MVSCESWYQQCGSESMAAGALTVPLNILCLHGYRQNSQSFREKTGAFRKLIKNRAKLVFINAPNIVPPVDENSDSEQRGWWFSREDDYYRAQDITDCDKGFQDSIKTVQQVFREEGPFDGVLAFSQGASFLSLLCGIQQSQKVSDIQFEFAIIVAGFKSRSSGHQELYTQKITCPSLHVYGDTDAVIPKDLSEELTECFTNPIILQHPGGHFVPASSAQKKIYIEFLSRMSESKKQKI